LHCTRSESRKMAVWADKGAPTVTWECDEGSGGEIFSTVTGYCNSIINAVECQVQNAVVTRTASTSNEEETSTNLRRPRQSWNPP
jgi:hypothetical protein